MLVGRPGEETVALIATTLLGHKTDNGLGPGSQIADFVRVYGEPTRGEIIKGSRASVVATDGSPGAWWPQLKMGVFYDVVGERVWGVVVFD